MVSNRREKSRTDFNLCVNNGVHREGDKKSQISSHIFITEGLPLINAMHSTHKIGAGLQLHSYHYHCDFFF